MQISFYTRISFSFPVGMVSLAGISAVELLIARTNVGTADTPHYVPGLPQTWNWAWVVTGRAAYVGTLPKRIWKYYYRTFGVKLPDTVVSQIGNIARANTETSAAYEFEFVTKIDWRAGDFGDGGSCYWGSRGAALELLADNGGFAVRFYEEGKGKGRAWMYQIQDGVYVLWNGYGFQGDSTLTIARVVATYLGMSYRRINLTNWNVDSGTLYINSGRGFLIGAADIIEGMDDEYDFQWGDQEYYDTCANCGDGLHEDEGYYAPDDNTYCESCYYELFDTCELCGETHDREHITYVESTRENVCHECLDARFTMCDNCGDYYPIGDVYERGGEWYCERHLPPEGEG